MVKIYMIHKFCLYYRVYDVVCWQRVCSKVKSATCFWIWRWIGMRPAIASILAVDDIWNTSTIYNATFLCIFQSSLKEYKSGALL